MEEDAFSVASTSREELSARAAEEARRATQSFNAAASRKRKGQVSVRKRT